MRKSLLVFCLLSGFTGCALERNNIWSENRDVPRTVRPVPLVQSAPRPKMTSLYSAEECEGMEFIEGEGLVKMSARRILGYDKNGEEIVIYDRDVEGPLQPREQANRLKEFLKGSR